MSGRCPVAGQSDACPASWCDETGEHSTHRRYVMSVPVAGGRWLVGVNVVTEPVKAVSKVELTVVGNGGTGAPMLSPSQAQTVGKAIVTAAHFAARVATRLRKQQDQL